MGNIDAKKSILPDYFVNDLSVNYEWKINKGIKTIVFSGLLNNILNRTYESNGYFFILMMTIGAALQLLPPLKEQDTILKQESIS